MKKNKRFAIPPWRPVLGMKLLMLALIMLAYLLELSHALDLTNQVGSQPFELRASFQCWVHALQDCNVA